MRVSESYLEIVNAEYLSGYRLRLAFNDGEVRLIDFEPFLRHARNPMIRKYLNLKLFQDFSIVYGDLVWCDYDLCFPMADLYAGKIEHDVRSDAEIEFAQTSNREVETMLNVAQLHLQYITNDLGKKMAVILPIEEFDDLLEDLEDLAVIATRRDEPTVSPESVKAALKQTPQDRPTVAALIQELRELQQQESVEIEMPERQDRLNPFMEMPDELFV